MKGAPLRFAAAVVGGWVLGRCVVLWPTPIATAVPVTHPTPTPPPVWTPPAVATTPAPVLSPAAIIAAVVPGRITAIPHHGPSRSPDVAAAPAAAPAIAPQIAGSPPRSVETAVVRRADMAAAPARPSRWAVDAWLVARPGGGDTLAFGQLGASQGGVRATYALDRRVAVSARLSTPWRGAGREIGLGVDVRPTRLPLHLLVEQRLDLDDGTTRPAIVAIAGGSVALPWRGRIDAYGQGGAVGRRGAFADGALRVTRPVLRRGDTRVELGAGTWGAAQRGAARLDVGPSIALVTPGAAGTLRLQLDYRARIAGEARPGSGPALTLGGSF